MERERDGWRESEKVRDSEVRMTEGEREGNFNGKVRGQKSKEEWKVIGRGKEGRRNRSAPDVFQALIIDSVQHRELQHHVIGEQMLNTSYHILHLSLCV
jgi:hypothetical protein